MKSKFLFVIGFLLSAFIGNAQNHSLNFDGSNDYVKVLKNASLQATTAMTIEAWINADTWKDQLYKGTVVSNGNNTGGNNGFDLRAAKNGSAELNIALNGNWVTLTTGEIMQTGKWYHLAGVFSGDSIKIYINGIMRAAMQVTGTLSTFNANFDIGECPGWTGRTFDGRIDDVRFWNTARTSQDIRTNLCGEITGTEPGLVGYWKFEEGTTTSTADATGHGFNGTLTGMVVAISWSTNFVCNLNNPDVGISQIISPSSGFALTAQESVSVLVTNFSLQPVSNISVSYTINGSNAITELITSSIPGLQNYTHTFIPKANLLTEQEYIFTAYTTLSNDSNITNNPCTKNVTNFNINSNFAVEFDGANDEILISDTTGLNFSNAFTLEAWIKADTWKDQIYQGTIIGKVEGTPDRGYNLGAGANGTVEFQISDNGSWNGVQSLPILKTGRWYHVAGVYDGASLKIYVNGKLQGVKSAGSIKNSTCNLMIGECPSWGGARNFDGRIDEVRIWNIARTENEIKSNLNQNLTGNETGLAAYWKLNEGLNQSTVNDLSGHNHSGTLNNFNLSNAWVTGYSLTQNDVGIVAILAPSNAPYFSSNARVKVEIMNYGFNNMSNFPVTFVINGSMQVSETVSDTIPAFSKAIYYFNHLADITANTHCNIVAYTNFQNDIDNTNDTIIANIIEADSVIIFNAVQHNFAGAGQVHTSAVILPESNNEFSQILLHYKLDCPSLGCDPWDQTGKISVITNDGLDYEIGRFMTPFGVACGPWTIDVTDFRTLLTGNVNFKSNIQVWGASGWLFTAWLEFIPGTPSSKYTKIDRLWNTDYQVYGDPNISYDLTAKNINIPANTTASKIRMTTTGHGQGNTSNAAEFYYPTHNITVNGTQTFSQYLHRICNTNICQPQSGTWQYERAGWCPGSDVVSDTYDMSSLITPGSSILIDYVLQNYTNTANTGYNGGSHTEPFYRIHSYLISGSNTPFTPVVDAAINSIISPTAGHLLSLSENISIEIKNNGTTDLSNFYVSYYINNQSLVTEFVTQTIAAGNTLNYTFTTPADLSQITTYNITSVITKSGDAIASNDFAKIALNTGITDENNFKYISVFPNPSEGILQMKISNYNGLISLGLYDLQGRLLFEKEESVSSYSNKIFDFSGIAKGMYLLKLKTKEGMSSHKICFK